MKKNPLTGFVFIKNERWKLFLAMRLTIVFLFCFMLGGNATIMAQYRLNMKMGETTFEELFQEIRKQTGCIVMYNNDMLNKNEKVDANFGKIELEELLEKILSDKGLTFEINREFVILMKAPQKREEQKKVTITGIVKDKQGESLIGVTVLVKGTSIGAVTDSLGRYKITLPEQQDLVLIFSFIGMQSKEVKINNQKEINVTLEEDIETLEEVVVSTGYYNRKKESYTGATTSFTGDKLRMVSSGNVLSTLSVLDPSFKLLDNIEMGSDPNTIPEFTIRGGGSLQSEYENSPNMPTFILDGFEVNAEKIFDLDPNRVASITILKDAAATAIYGSRASNGVVVVETVEPQAGKLRLNYTFSGDFSFADLSVYDLMNATEKLEYERLAKLYTHSNIEMGDRYTDLYNQRLKWVQEGIDTDWLSKPIKDLGFGHKHFLLIEGGDSSIRYALSVNYNKTDGVMKKSGRRTVGIGSKLQYNYKNLRFINDLTYSNVKGTNSPYGSFTTYTYQNPYFHPYDENGNVKQYLYEPTLDGDVLVTNPLYNAAKKTRNESTYSEFNNNFSIEWNIMEGMTLRGKFSLNSKQENTDDFKPATHTDFATTQYKGSYQKGEQKTFTYDANIVFNYARSFIKHNINLAAVWNVRESNIDSYSVTAVNYPNEQMDHFGMGTAFQDGAKPAGDYEVSRLMGFAGNVNYGWDNRYLLDLSIRTDGSSVYGANQRWGTFGSIGIAWNIHREKWFENSRIVNNLKLRGSIGSTGGQNFYPFQSIRMFSYKDDLVDGITYNGSIGALLKSYGNTDLKWQKNLKRNIGLDFALFTSRLSGYVNFYKEDSKALLIDVLLAPSTGFDSYKDNLGEVENQGIETNIRGSVIRDTGKELQWDLFVSLMSNRNRLLKLNDALAAYNRMQDDKVNNANDDQKSNRPVVRYQKGKSINAIWANESLGIDPNSGQEIFLDQQGNKVDKWSTDNYKPLGCTDPDVEGSFGTMFMYKGFQLNAFFKYSIGGDIYNQTLVDKVENVNPKNNADRRVLYDRWKEAGDIARFKAIDNTETTMPTSRFIEKENYVQLSSLSVSYRFPVEKLRRLGMESLKVTAIGNDIFRASTVKMERGTVYPFARTYTLSLQVTF